MKQTQKATQAEPVIAMQEGERLRMVGTMEEVITRGVRTGELRPGILRAVLKGLDIVAPQECLKQLTEAASAAGHEDLAAVLDARTAPARDREAMSTHFEEAERHLVDGLAAAGLASDGFCPDGAELAVSLTRALVNLRDAKDYAFGELDGDDEAPTDEPSSVHARVDIDSSDNDQAEAVAP